MTTSLFGVRRAGERCPELSLMGASIKFIAVGLIGGSINVRLPVFEGVLSSTVCSLSLLDPDEVGRELCPPAVN